MECIYIFQPLDEVAKLLAEINNPNVSLLLSFYLRLALTDLRNYIKPTYSGASGMKHAQAEDFYDTHGFASNQLYEDPIDGPHDHSPATRQLFHPVTCAGGQAKVEVWGESGVLLSGIGTQIAIRSPFYLSSSSEVAPKAGAC